MSTFSERNGFVKKKKIKNDITKKLKTRISNSINIILHSIDKNNLYYLIVNIYRNFLEEDLSDFDLFLIVDNFYYDSSLYNYNLFTIDINKLNMNKMTTLIMEYYKQIEEWYIIFDFIEFLLKTNNISEKLKSDLIVMINDDFKKHNAQYNIINKSIVPLNNKNEINEIEQALNLDDEFLNVKILINKSLELLSNRENPDYENSIKEAIGAVESLSMILTGEKESLGKLTNKLKVHPAFKGALNKLFGWTSADGNIRHGSSEKPSREYYNEAKFMIVTCSAYINYIIAEHAEGNI